MIKRRKTKQISIGNIKIGGDAPISVQSMCNTDTRDTKTTLTQIHELAAKGCELVRLAVLNAEAADAIKDIVKKSPVPLIADIHFDYKLAIKCINNGINALRHIKILEDLDFDLIKVSLKSSDVLTTIEAYRSIAEKIPYPLHLGVTEAGTLRGGLIKSSVGLGTLLAEGIGDTIRVSLTENPVEEVSAGFDILKSLGLREKGVNFVSCPTCGRTQIDLIGLAKKVEERFKNFDKPITIATMGCAVNGPGEARHADFGIAGGVNEGIVFKKGEIIAKVPENQLLEKLEEIIIKSYK